MAQPNKISYLNDSFDLGLLLLISKRSLLWILLFFLFSTAIAFIYLRYTEPVYQTQAIIQLNSTASTSKFLAVTNIYDESIYKEIELLKSSEFLTRAISNLNLDISYFRKGTVLNYEVYQSSPFRVGMSTQSIDLYNTPIYLTFFEDKTVEIKYRTGDVQNTSRKSLRDSITMPHFRIKIEFENYKKILDLQSEGSQYFFQLNNPNLKISNITTPLTVEVLNEVAKTIKISYRDKNPEKTADVVNAIANDFISYDVENKEQSADNILRFLDDQLALLYDKLIETEEHLNDFRQRYGIVEKLDGANNGLPDPISTRNLEYLTKIDQINDLLYGIDFDIELLKKIKNEASNDYQKVDFNKTLSGLSLTQLQGAFVSQLQTLNQIQLEREKLLYDVTNNSDQVKRIDYQIKIQNRLIY